MRRFDGEAGPDHAVPALDDVLVITHPPRKLDRRTLEHFGPNGFGTYAERDNVGPISTIRVFSECRRPASVAQVVRVFQASSASTQHHQIIRKTPDQLNATQ